MSRAILVLLCLAATLRLGAGTLSPQLVSAPSLGCSNVFGGFEPHVALGSAALSTGEQLDCWLYLSVATGAADAAYGSWRIYPEFTCIYYVSPTQVRWVTFSGRSVLFNLPAPTSGPATLDSPGISRQSRACGYTLTWLDAGHCELQGSDGWHFRYSGGELVSARSPRGAVLTFRGSGGHIHEISEGSQLLFALKSDDPASADLAVADARYTLRFDSRQRLVSCTRLGVGPLFAATYDAPGFPASYSDRGRTHQLLWRRTDPDFRKFAPILSPFHLAGVDDVRYDLYVDAQAVRLSEQHHGRTESLTIRLIDLNRSLCEAFAAGW